MSHRSQNAFWVEFGSGLDLVLTSERVFEQQASNDPHEMAWLLGFIFSAASRPPKKICSTHTSSLIFGWLAGLSGCDVLIFDY